MLAVLALMLRGAERIRYALGQTASDSSGSFTRISAIGSIQQGGSVEVGDAGGKGGNRVLGAGKRAVKQQREY